MALECLIWIENKDSKMNSKHTKYVFFLNNLQLHNYYIRKVDVFINTSIDTSLILFESN